MSGTIIVVDPQATSRISLKVRLNNACYRTMVAAGADSAWALASDERPGLVVIDESIDGGKGFDLCRRLRTDAATRHIPVLMLIERSTRLAALRAGATEVMEKPLDDMMFFARIRSCLRGHAEIDHAVPIDSAIDEPFTMTLIAPDQTVAAIWQEGLAARLDCKMHSLDWRAALSRAAEGDVTDLYLIGADLDRHGDGLNVLSELRARPHTRSAAYLVALPSDRVDMAPVALDLGAGDILPLALNLPSAAEEAALRIRAQIRRKREADRSREDASRNRMLAITDPLTGLYNRRFALPQLDQLLKIGDGPLAALMLDLDRFKAVNDRYGHATGDAALRHCARIMQTALPQNAILARLGGEEFLAVLPEVEVTRALSCAEMLREEIANQPVCAAESDSDAVPISVSIGVAMGWAGLTAPYAETGSDMICRADAALMRAKRAGRNMVILAAQEQAA